jgi:hypothetical protein
MTWQKAQLVGGDQHTKVVELQDEAGHSSSGLGEIQKIMLSESAGNVGCSAYLRMMLATLQVMGDPSLRCNAYEMSICAFA